MDRVNLQSLTRRQLVGLAKKAGIPRQYRLAKTQLIAALEAARIRQAEPPDPEELPQNYGRTRLTLLEVEPYWVFAYWEVTTEDCGAAAEKLGGDGQWVLRFFDVGGAESAAGEAHFFDVFVDLAAGNWYVNLWAGGKTYVAEFGLLSAEGQFVPVCRSNTIRVPPTGSAPESESRWLKVDNAAAPVEPVPAAPPEPIPLPVQSREDRGAESATPAAAPAPSPPDRPPETVPAPSAIPEPSPLPAAQPAPQELPSSEDAGGFGLGKFLGPRYPRE